MICVDELRQIKDDNIQADSKNSHLQWGCFLYTDKSNLEVLHAFAKAINLSRNDFKSDNFLPRYILNSEKRKQAIAKGAVQVLFRKTVEVCRENKSKSASAAYGKREKKVKSEK